LEWARALLEEAREDNMARGDVITLDEHRVRNATRLVALRK
jgi:hypothetical protein